MDSSLRSRWLTALVGLPAVFLALWAGGGWWAALVSTVVLLGLWEWQRMLNSPASPASLATPGPGAGLVGAGAIFLACLWGFARGSLPLKWVLGAALVLCAFVAVWEGGRGRALARAGWAVAGLLTVAAGLGHLILLREGPDGFLWTVTALGGAWVTDTGAFFIGRRLGGPPLAPRLSPRKTVSGSAGGLAAALLWCGWMGSSFLSLSRGSALALGVAVGLLAQSGDLFESAFKRSVGVKDSGRILPGHGGILDRFDSLLFTAPAVYYLRMLLSF